MENSELTDSQVINTFVAQRTATKDLISNLIKKNQELIAKNADLEAKLVQADIDLEDMRKNVKAHIDRYQELKDKPLTAAEISQKDQCQSFLQGVVRKLQNDIKYRDAKIIDLEKDLEKIIEQKDKHINDIQVHVMDLENQVENLNDNYIKSQDKEVYENIKAENRKLRFQINMNGISLGKRMADLETCEKDNEQLRSRIDELNSLLGQPCDTCGSDKEALKQKDEHIADLQEKVMRNYDQYSADTKYLHTIIDNQRATIKDLHIITNTQSTTISDLEDQIKMTGPSEALRHDNKRLYRQNDDLRKEIQQVRGDNQHLRDEINILASGSETAKVIEWKNELLEEKERIIHELDKRIGERDIRYDELNSKYGNKVETFEKILKDNINEITALKCERIKYEMLQQEKTIKAAAFL